MEQSFETHLAALLFTFSILFMFSLVLELQIADAYSTCGRTRVLYAIVLMSLFLVMTFLLTKPSVFSLAGNIAVYKGVPDQILADGHTQVLRNIHRF